MIGEFDIIRNFFARSRKDSSLVVDIGDDGAVLRPSPGRDLVVVTDTINKDRHFPDDMPPADIGWRAAAVNLSDIAAMGAKPRHAFLNLSLEEADPAWLESFSSGLFEALDNNDTVLAGGDTTQGPLSVSVTIIGELPRGEAILRSGSRVGDLVLVSGTPGDAAAGLERMQQGVALDDELVRRFRRPVPRLALGQALRGIATAMIDISDGLLADLGHMLESSAVGAIVETEMLPVSSALKEFTTQSAEYVLGGGDDYELCFTVPPAELQLAQKAAQECKIPVTVIGRITAAKDLEVLDEHGRSWQPRRRGWEHFKESGK